MWVMCLVLLGLAIVVRVIVAIERYLVPIKLERDQLKRIAHAPYWHESWFVCCEPFGGWNFIVAIPETETRYAVYATSGARPLIERLSRETFTGQHEAYTGIMSEYQRRVSSRDRRGLMILVTGPHRVGKSTLARQIFYSLDARSRGASLIPGPPILLGESMREMRTRWDDLLRVAPTEAHPRVVILGDLDTRVRDADKDPEVKTALYALLDRLATTPYLIAIGTTRTPLDEFQRGDSSCFLSGGHFDVAYTLSHEGCIERNLRRQRRRQRRKIRD